MKHWLYTKTSYSTSSFLAWVLSLAHILLGMGTEGRVLTIRKISFLSIHQSARLWCFQLCLWVVLLFVSDLNAHNTTIRSEYIDPSVVGLKIESETNTRIDVFQLFSHGRSGELFINGQWLGKEAIVHFLGSHLSLLTSHINIYGCNFAQGQKGKAAVAYLEKELGISVSASTNITGIDGDWNLEVGKTNNVIALPNYQGNLQCPLGTTIGASQYALASSGGYPADVAIGKYAAGAPDGYFTSAYSTGTDYAVNLSYLNNFYPGDEVTLTAAYNDSRIDGIYLDFSIDGVNWQTSPLFNPPFTTTLTDYTYKIPTSFSGPFAYIQIRGNSANSYVQVDAVKVTSTSCNMATVNTYLDNGAGGGTSKDCIQNGTEPSLGTASGLFINIIKTGAVVNSFPVGNPTTLSNLADGSYTMIISENPLDVTSKLYTYTTSSASKSISVVNGVITPAPLDFCMQILDSDSDGISDSIDLDDDNDGILDTAEMTSATPPTCAATISGQPDFWYDIDNVSPCMTCLATNVDGNPWLTTNFSQFSRSWISGNGWTIAGGSINGAWTFSTYPTTIANAIANNNYFEFSYTPKNYMTMYDFKSFSLDADVRIDYSTSSSFTSPTTIYTGHPVAPINFTNFPLTTPLVMKPGVQYFIRVYFANITPESARADVDTWGWHWRCPTAVEYPAALTTADKDTDGDGIADRFDLDSDGDGCPDALEGGANLAATSLVTSSIAGGNSGAGYTGTSTSPVVKNLGNTIDANGIPTIAGTGQTVGNSANKLVQSANCGTCNAGTTAPSVSGTTLSNTCPATTVNLSSLVTSTAPSGTSLEWFTDSTHTGTAYATPTTAAAGTYYAFYYDAVNGCYSPADSVTVTINSCASTSCSANLITNDNNGTFGTNTTTGSSNVTTPPPAGLYSFVYATALAAGAYGVVSETGFTTWNTGYWVPGRPGNTTGTADDAFLHYYDKGYPAVIYNAPFTLTSATSINYSIDFQPITNTAPYATKVYVQIVNSLGTVMGTVNSPAFTASDPVAWGTIANSVTLPAGTYTLMVINTSTNSAGLIDNIKVTTACPVGQPDLGSIGGITGGTVIPNVTANDQVYGGADIGVNVTIAPLGTWTNGISLNTSTGAVTVPPNTPVGTYTFSYNLCEIGSTVNCSATPVTINVGTTATSCGGFGGLTGPNDDYDGDSVCNKNDLDDDNDGILDDVESPTCATTVSTATYPALWNANGIPLNNTPIPVVWDTYNPGSSALPNLGMYSNVTNLYGLQWVGTDSYDIFTSNTDPITFTVAGGDIDKTGDPTQSVYSSYASFFEYNTQTPVGATVTYTNVYDVTGKQLMNMNDIEFFSVGYGYGTIKGTPSTIDPSVVSITNPTSGTFVVTKVSTNDAIMWNFRTKDGSLLQRYSGSVVGMVNDGFIPGLYRNIGCTIVKDSDGDGIADKFDLDSDNDGCTDAIEGGASFTSANLVASTLSGGNTGATSGTFNQPVTQNLGNTVDANGIPTIATATGQTVGTSQNAAALDAQGNCVVTCNDPTKMAANCDYDGDGVINSIDIDDDNDGILDSDESACAGTPTWLISAAQKTGITLTTDLTLASGTIDAVLDGSNTGVSWFTNAQTIVNKSVFTIQFPTATAINQIELLKGTATVAITGTYKIQASTNGTTWTDLTGSTATPVNVLSTNFPALDAQLFSFANAGAFKYYRIYGLTGTASSSPYLNELNFALPCITNDKDGDGIVNMFDLDSDGDGCPDALEGGAGFASSVLTASTLAGGSTNVTTNLGNTVDAKGVPTIATATGQTIGTSEMLIFQSANCPCTDVTQKAASCDYDGDGIVNSVDLDDDNDGILDATEQTCTAVNSSNSNPTFSSYDYYHAGTTFTMNQELIDGAINTNIAQGPASIMIADSVVFRMKGVLASSGNMTFTLYNDAGQLGNDEGWRSFQYAALLDPNGNIISAIPFRDFGPTGSVPSVNVDTIVFSGPIANAAKLVFYEVTQRSGVSDWGLRELTGPTTGFSPICSDKDTDGDGIADRLDLDSDGDGCSDALEGGANLAATSLVTSSIAGGNSGTNYTGTSTSPVVKNLGNTVDANGIPTIAGVGQTVGNSADKLVQSANCGTCNAGTTAPSVSATTLSNTCPATTVNLNSLVTSTAPSGASLVWFTDSTHTGTAYATPTAATADTFYAFYHDAVNGCYSPADSVIVTINDCTDTDGDGILDSIDLDDDNDGILDTVECPALVDIPIVKNGSFDDGFNNWTTTGAWSPYPNPGEPFAYNTDDVAYYQVLRQSIDLSQALVVGGYYTFKFKTFTNGAGFVILNNYYADLDLYYNNTLFVNIKNPIGSTDATVTASNGATVNISSFPITDFPNGFEFDDIIVKIPVASVPVTGNLDFYFTSNGDDIAVDGISVDKIPSASNLCDTDGDGIANYLDLDSDGDGCPDALEGGANLAATSLVTSSIAGGNSGAGYTGTSTSPVVKNLGNTVDANGIPTIAGAGQTVGNSADKLVQSANCVTCLAGTAAPIITPTTAANTCPSATINLATLPNTGTKPAGTTLIWSTHSTPLAASDTLSNLTISTAGTYYALYYDKVNNCYSPADSVVVTITNCTDFDGDGILDTVDLDDDNDGILDLVECPVLVPPTVETITGPTAFGTVTYTPSSAAVQTLSALTNGSIADAINIIPANTGTPTVFTIPLVTPRDVNQFFLYNDAGAPGDAVANFTVKLYNASNTLLTTLTAVGTNGVVKNQWDFPITAKNVTKMEFTTIYWWSHTNGNSQIREIALGYYDKSCDTDGDGIANSFDLDSDNDGCSDAFEAGATTNTTPNYQFPAASVGTNGLSSSVENNDTPSATTTYTSTYSIAINSGIKSCCPSTAPTLSGTTISNTCPATTANLNSLVTSTAPSGASLVWFTDNTHTGTAYATPTTAAAGTYYAFYFDATNNCYSPATSGAVVTSNACNDAPVITSTTTVNYAENGTTPAYTTTATDPNAGQTKTYSFETGGVDNTLFTINPTTGEVSFNTSPNFESPTDAGADNVYNIKVKVCDNGSPVMCDTIDVAITVTDVVECLAGTTDPSVSATNLSNTCPSVTANLNNLVTSTAPSGASLVWFTNSAHTGTAYATPTTAVAGTYYAFYFDATNNCYSPATSGVVVAITTCSVSCDVPKPSIISN